jgi:RHH-type transcriptional regulator, proline utilization regulon repressor / proline dehydrogenase / delta 1-pyrroline-5-carboxylate dehydrogenase
MTRVSTDRMTSPAALEERTRTIGRALFDRVGKGARVWERAWWDDRLMNLTMGDPKVKVQLFRFIDALPALRTHEEVRAHLAEYLNEAGDRLAWWLRLPLDLSPPGSLRARVLAWAARWGAMHMAHRFIAGETPEQALATVRRLRKRSLAFTADLLGEAVISEAEADQYQAACLNLLRGLAGPLVHDRELPQIDRDQSGPIPRLNLSLKLTSLTARFDALHAEATTERVLGRLRPILRAARSAGAFVNVDMEQYAYKDLTNAIVQEILLEPEFRDWAGVGVVAQAYLQETEDDLRAWLAYVERRGTPITVRLVKGAYWDYEVLHAQQVGWPVPVHGEKWRTDACYERCAHFLMAHHDRLRPALGSHNVRSLAFGMAAAEAFDVPGAAYELQMLYGMAEPIQRALVEWGRRVRVYTPYGRMLPGMAYLVRRLLENTSNESFLKASFAGRAQVDDLLRNPEEVGAMWNRSHRRQAVHEIEPGWPPFRNEPPTDFTKAEARERMRRALDEVRKRMPFSCALVIGAQHVRTEQMLESNDPSEKSRTVGQTSRAIAEHASAAVAVAREAFAGWSATPARARADVLHRAAEILRREKFTLAAIEVYECGKPWREADADIAEAIDFCEFYAREMLRLSERVHHDMPGETNAVERIARGVAVIIPPWNFPLAIPTGMTVAALVTGNTAILKPAEQSPVIAFQLVRILQEAGLPPGVLSFLPGVGEEVGQALVDDPGVDLIAFTGSRPVGLEINRRAAETKPGQDHVKRVIAEMGGKNAIIIDSDADLDEAVVGVNTSAFGYSGQKCSACSRVIVLEGVYEPFLARLTEAARDLPVGPAAEPDTIVGPLIDAEAQARFNRYKQIAAEEGQVVLAVDVGQLAERGHFVGPLIVAGVKPEARVAQEEIFAPLLAVLKARDLDEALAIANGTDYALTGGLYSRSPANIERVKQAFRVGNLYINRPITGALVGRQPFGGFKLSGVGTKAGGDDYLLEFLLARSVTENTMRRGFAPEVEIAPASLEQPAEGVAS